MYCLAGCYVEEESEDLMKQAIDSKTNRQYFAIKVHIPPTQS